MDVATPLPDRRTVAQVLLRDAGIDRLRTEARLNRRWSAIFRGFRPDFLTRAILVRYAHAFGRDSTLLSELANVFLDSLGISDEGNIHERFATATELASLSPDTIQICSALARHHVDELPPQPAEPESDIETPAVETSVEKDDTGLPEALEETEHDEHEPEGRPNYVTQVVELEWSPPSDNAVEVHQAVTMFERSLCAFVMRQLQGLYGDAWLRKGCGSIRKVLRERAENLPASGQANDLLNPVTLLGLAHLPELRDVIVRKENWPAFEAYFDDKLWFTTEFQRILPVRIGGAHAGQREMYLVEQTAALAAMVDIASRYHIATAEAINDIYRSALNASPVEDDRAESRIASNLRDFSDPHVVGREPEMRRLQEFWADDFSRVISIVGQGGVGKTALLDEFTYRLLTKPLERGQRPDPEAIIYLTAKDNYLEYMKRAPAAQQFRTLERIYEVTLLTAAGDTREGSELAGLRREVLELAKSMRIFFALDNLESLTDAEYAEVGVFLDEIAAPSKAIVTTRLTRRVGKDIELTGLPAADARQFLLTRLQGAGMDIADEDTDRIDELVEYTDGVPLALVYCANAIRNGRTIEETLAAIKGRVFLELLQFSFESSLQALTTDGLRILLFLALSKHPRTRRELLEVVADDAQFDRAIASLRSMSFINLSWEQKKQIRFSVQNPQLKDYVKKRAPEELTKEQYAFVLKKARVLPTDAESPSVSVEIERALATARSLDWREAAQELESARHAWGDDPELLAQLGYYYYRLENRAAARPLLEQAIREGNEVAETYFYLALVHFYDGRIDDALRCARAALTLRSPFPLAEGLAGQCLAKKAEAGKLLFDGRTIRSWLEEAKVHLNASVIAEERGPKDEERNRRAQASLNWIDRQLSALPS